MSNSGKKWIDDGGRSRTSTPGQGTGSPEECSPAGAKGRTHKSNLTTSPSMDSILAGTGDPGSLVHLKLMTPQKSGQRDGVTVVAHEAGTSKIAANGGDSKLKKLKKFAIICKFITYKNGGKWCDGRDASRLKRRVGERC